MGPTQEIFLPHTLAALSLDNRIYIIEINTFILQTHLLI